MTDQLDPKPVIFDRFVMTTVGRTDVGAQRTQNEDAMYYDDFQIGRASCRERVCLAV